MIDFSWLLEVSEKPDFTVGAALKCSHIIGKARLLDSARNTKVVVAFTRGLVELNLFFI